MDSVPDNYGEFWKYLSQTQKDLILQGDYLMNNVIKNQNYEFKDYSFLIFPYAKAYEGFLKQLFLDIKFISHLDYISTHLRLGKLMSPNLVQKLGDRSIYQQIINRSSQSTADIIWQTWTSGRNQIFHYFPHNLRAVTFNEAEEIITQIIQTMEIAYKDLKPDSKHVEERKEIHG
jgi:hypothetical protein